MTVAKAREVCKHGWMKEALNVLEHLLNLSQIHFKPPYIKLNICQTKFKKRGARYCSSTSYFFNHFLFKKLISLSKAWTIGWRWVVISSPFVANLHSGGLVVILRRWVTILFMRWFVGCRLECVFLFSFMFIFLWFEHCWFGGRFLFELKIGGRFLGGENCWFGLVAWFPLWWNAW